MTIVNALEEEGAAVSSTRIRAALAQGDVGQAAKLLGWRFAVAGTIEHGEKRGRELGYPTANMALDPGERALQRHLCGARCSAATDRCSTAWRATAAARPSAAARRCSRHSLFDFSGDLYDEEALVAFYGLIRPEEKFDERGGAGRADGAGFHRCPGAARANAGRGAGSERLPGVGEGVKWRSSRQARRAAPQAGWLTPSHSASPID